VGILTTFLFIGVVVVAYYRYRDHFYALESATDSNKGHAFWTILAVLFALVIGAAFVIFHWL
jgi:hypothetical protein